MSLTILIASPNKTWSEEIRKSLESQGFNCLIVHNGKEGQVRASKEKISIAILDSALEDYSATEVLKFLKIKSPITKVIFLIKDQNDLDFLGKKSFHSAGISETLLPPHSVDRIKRIIDKLAVSSTWKNIDSMPKGSNSTHFTKIRDSEVSAINIKEFYSGKVTLFDHYIRIGVHNYKRILNKGDVFEPSRLEKYQQEGLEYFYILSKERLKYINFVNESIKSSIVKSKTDTSTLINPIKSITMKFLEETHTMGLNPQLAEEGRSVCQNMYELINREKSLKKSLDQLQELNPSSMSHAFLVSFFSVVICKNLDWAGKRTIDTISLGALLHDIGILGLPPALREAHSKKLSSEQEKIFQTHSTLGVQLLQNNPVINEQVLQIIYQHHEHNDGSGYPNNLSGSRIYQLAKIVSLADAFSDIMIENKTNPKDTMRMLLRDRQNILKFDPMFLKSLALGIAR